MSSKGFVNMAKSGKLAAIARRRQAAAQPRLENKSKPTPPLPGKTRSSKGGGKD